MFTSGGIQINTASGYNSGDLSLTTGESTLLSGNVKVGTGTTSTGQSGTLQIATGSALGEEAGVGARVKEITARAMNGELDFEGALTTRVAMLKGLGLPALQQAYDARISLNTGAKTLVETMKAYGAMTVLVSGGFTFFTGRVAEEAGFAAHRGNTLLDDGAALTGGVGLPILGREAKLSALDEFSSEAGLSRADSIALGDGANDLAMIQAAGLGIAYKAKPIVAAEAHAAINHTDLHAALFFQGYHADEFVTN